MAPRVVVGLEGGDFFWAVEPAKLVAEGLVGADVSATSLDAGMALGGPLVFGARGFLSLAAGFFPRFAAGATGVTSSAEAAEVEVDVAGGGSETVLASFEDSPEVLA